MENNNSIKLQKALPLGRSGGKIVVIDNYDSFTYNLVHYLEDLNCQVTVFRNDEFDIDELQQFDKILLSPGPGIPDEAGLLKEVIKTYASSKSILGVCLGQQAIGEVFGGTLTNLEKVYHGVATNVTITNPDDVLFKDLPSEFEVGRYHSWVVNNDNFPNELIITSIDGNGQIMSLKHNKFDVRGVQFHPESVLTPNGKKILENWVNSRQ
jgi:anthranilate synthase component II